jgi:hypothetical protein
MRAALSPGPARRVDRRVWHAPPSTGHAAGVASEPTGPDDVPVRSWTVDEANAALIWVGGVVARAQDRFQRYRGQASRRARLVRQNGHGLVPADPSAIQECLDELAAEGVVLRDIDRGLVDFPAQAPSGRWYWLCWLVGEDAVTWWHWPEDGFAGRTPIDQPPR